jgi:TonB-dependent starch-binding outer membrane protein SusC
MIQTFAVRFDRKPIHIKHMLMRIFFTIALFMSVLAVSAQVLITGTVKDASGSTLPGVNVLLKSTSQGTVTDMEGN